MRWDVFVSHASEDKEALVEPLVRALEEAGLSVWYDRIELRLGDSLRERIDEGLAHSRFGIVVLSPSFFAKHWPVKELNGLAQREVDGNKVILPVWFNISTEQVRRQSPMLADRIAARWSDGIGAVIAGILDVVSAGRVPTKEGHRIFFGNEDRPPASMEIGFHKLLITGELHRYSLSVSLTLDRPPDQGRFRLRISWPRDVRISRLLNIREGEEGTQQGLIYRELWLDCDYRIFPGQIVKVIGPESFAELDYEFDRQIWRALQERPRDMFYTLYHWCPADDVSLAGKSFFH